MPSRMEQKMAEALIKARDEDRRARRNVRLSAVVFWSLTAGIAVLIYRDTMGLFTSTWGIRWLTLWIIPALWYIVSSRWARAAAEHWKITRKNAAGQARPGFCSHENDCSCREDFCRRMEEEQDIDLYM